MSTHNNRPPSDVENATAAAFAWHACEPMLRSGTDMTKRKPQKRELRPVTDTEIDEVLAEALAGPPPAPTPSLHELFDQQTRAILESPDLDEEQKQNILVAMRCPCCGGGSGTFSFKLKPRG
jgi:hypothetical protein